MSTPRLATREHDGWWLSDGEEAHAESPESFWIPHAEARRGLAPGDIAKLRFYILGPDASGEEVEHGERMWVQVLECKAGWYRGALDNDPHCTDRLQAGMKLWFQPRHVIDIHQG